MMKFLAICACLVWVPATSAQADRWISLGGNFGLGSQLNTSSIRKVDGVTYLTMRMRGKRDKGVLTLQLDLAVYCKQGYYIVRSGQVTSDWSSRVVPSPSVPDRFPFPTNNADINNMYDYVCH